MKKFLKIICFVILGIIAILYITFLFVLPKVVDINQYKADIQKIIKEQANIDFECEGMSLVTTPALGAGIKTGSINISLPDGSNLLSADGIKAVVSIPKLLLLTVKVPCFEIYNPNLNIEILETGEDYKIVKLIEDILNKNKAATFAEKPAEKAEKFTFNPEWIKIIIPNVKLNNYKLQIIDLASKHYLDLHGEQLVLGYFNGKRVKIKTNSELFSDENKNITANIDINTVLPEPAPKLDKEDDPAERIDIPFINPVTAYQNYDLKANIDSKIRINKNKQGKISSFGHFNIENLTVKFSTVRLPESYLRVKTFGTNVDLDTDIYTTKEENLHLFGKLNYGKHPKLDISLQAKTIKFENLLTLTKAIFESLQIPNEINQYKAKGGLIADCNIKSNFKKLKSSGFIKIADGGLIVRDLGEILSKMNINLIFDNNALNIKDSSLYIQNSPVKIQGLIDKKSYTDISIITENIHVPLLFDAFAPKEIRNDFNLKSADVSSSLTVNGKMKKAVAKADFTLNNLDFADRQNTFNIKNKMFNAGFDYSAKNKTLTGDINNIDLKILFPKTGSNVSLPETTIKIQDKNIILEEDVIKFNDKSSVKYSGNILNYERLSNIDFKMNGNINTDDLIKFIGQEMKPFMNAKGTIPLEILFSGNRNKQTLLAQIFPDDSAYITPLNFTRLQSLKTLLRTKIDFKPNRIKIKDTGFYTRAYVYDEKGNETVILNKIIGIDGTIENDTINLLKIDIPKNQDCNLQIFPKSMFTLNSGKLFLYGKTDSPLFKGNLRIEKLYIPEILTGLSSASLNFKEDRLNINLDKIMLADSDINIKGKLSLIPDIVSNIYDLDINSDYLNIDDINTVSAKAMSYMPEGETSNTSSNTNSIPVIVHNGIVNMNKIVTGNIELKNTKTDLTVAKNILALRKLSTDIFKGKVNGNIYIDLISMLIDTDLTGSDIDVEKALLDSSGMKDSLSGTADFTSKLLINGAAATPEAQMAGINGDVDFTVTNGQFGPFGKLENLILAENIRESQFFQTALGGIINSLATIDTTHFSELTGHVSLKDGMCNIDPITSKGNVMNLHILGNFDLLKNYADMKVRVKLTSVISSLLGPLNAINPINIMSSTASLNVVTAKAFSLFCETVTEEELAILPKFSNSYEDFSATKFQLGVRGDVAKPFTLIKSFKWLATQAQFDSAQEFTSALPDPTEESQATNIEEAIQEAKALEAEKKTLKYKIKNFFKRKKK